MSYLVNKGWQPSRHGLEHLIFPFILWLCGTGRFDVDSFAVYVPTAEAPGCSFGLRAENWTLRFLGVVVLRSVLLKKTLSLWPSGWLFP